MYPPIDQIRNRADEAAILEGCYWDEEAGLRVVRFIETFVRAKGGRKAKEPFKLFAWQRALIVRLFSWKRADGTRRFRSGWISVARQNGKSFIVSAIALYMLMADGEIAPAVASCANSRKQASLIYKNLAFFIERSDKLTKACHLVPSQKLVEVPKTHGSFQSLSADAKNNLGDSYSCVIADECSFFQNAGKALIDALKPATSARDQPLFLMISTAGTDFTSPGYEAYEYAVKVRDGVSEDTSFFSAIYEADEACPVDDEAQWHKANPSLCEGSLSLDELREAATKAKHSKTAEVAFRYFRLNRWTKGLTSFIAVDRWDACRGSFPTWHKPPLYIGLDFASSKDLCGLTGVIPYEGKLYVLAHAWTPQAACQERVKENRQRYELFADEGSLTITPGNGTDYRQVRAFIDNLAQLYEVKEIVADPNYGNETLMALMQDGYTVYRFAQTPKSYTDPTKRLEAVILDRTLVHDGSNLMRWQVQNLQVERSGEDMVKPSKGKSADKIDNVCALIMALSRAVGHETNYKPRRSAYEDRGIFAV